jgi:hypothetical protein
LAKSNSLKYLSQEFTSKKRQKDKNYRQGHPFGAANGKNPISIIAPCHWGKWPVDRFCWRAGS